MALYDSGKYEPIKNCSKLDFSLFRFIFNSIPFNQFVFFDQFSFVFFTNLFLSSRIELSWTKHWTIWFDLFCTEHKPNLIRSDLIRFILVQFDLPWIESNTHHKIKQYIEKMEPPRLIWKSPTQNWRFKFLLQL